jgi:hypothetical protein
MPWIGRRISADAFDRVQEEKGWNPSGEEVGQGTNLLKLQRSLMKSDQSSDVESVNG